MERISCMGLNDCVRLANKDWQVILSTEVGPRILFYGKVGGQNHLGEFPDAGETTDFGRWKPYAGHRLWVAPESKPFSYAPDNEPIEVKDEGNLSVRLVQKTDAAEIDKEIVVSLDPLNSHVQVGHRITNRAAVARDLAVWALTVFRGGTAHAPLERFRSHDDALLPSQPLILWPFTDLADSRIELGGGWLKLRTDPALESPQKLGLLNRRRWAAHSLNNELFIKRFNYCDGEAYPDFGSNCEFYAAGDYMEIETLSPLKRLEPGGSMEHSETWELHDVDGTVDELLATQNRLN